MALSNLYLAKHTGKEIDAGIDKIPGIEEELAKKYVKPESGIPETDLSQDVKNSLANANSAVQTDAMNTAIGNAKTELIGTDSDTKDSKTIEGAKKYAKDYADGLNTDVGGRLDTLEGDENTVGSVAKALKDAKAYTDSELEGAELTDTTYTFADGANTEEDKGAFTVTPEGGVAQKVKIGGLKSAAYTESTAYDEAGAASAVKTELIGEASDTKDKDTIKGAKAYAKDYADGKDSAMNTRMTEAEGKLTTLTGADTVDGSVAKALKDAKAYTDDAKKALVGADADEGTADTIKGAKKYAADEAAKKVASVTKADESVVIGGTATAPTVGVQLDPTEGNAIKLVAGKGLRVQIPTADTYSIVKEGNSGDYAAIYRLTKTNAAGQTEKIGAEINIPKDLVVKSGEVVELTAGQAGEGKPAGSYIKLVLLNDEDHPLYIYVGDLIEYVTSGSQANDAVQVAVDDTTHKVTASIKEGSLTKAMLDSGVQASLDLADNAVQKVEGQRLMTDAEGTKLAGIADGAQTNVIEKVQVNGADLSVTNKTVNVSVPTGALASKDKIDSTDLTEALFKRITDLESQVAALNTLLSQENYEVMFIKKETQPTA